MTIAITPAARLFTDFDQLDIAEAVRNAANYRCTTLDNRDRQALALLASAPTLPATTRTLLAELAAGTAALPLPTTQAMHLLDVICDDILGPEPEWPVQEAWLAARKPAASPRLPDDERSDLAGVPHSVTIEPITALLRGSSDLPAHATLVVVERHAGRLAKVCDTTDVHAARIASWGHEVTIESLARGIADTYGATYVPAGVAECAPQSA